MKNAERSHRMRKGLTESQVKSLMRYGQILKDEESMKGLDFIRVLLIRDEDETLYWIKMVNGEVIEAEEV